ncbi:hypothetical protein EC973_008723 [Apophysomyces ossiformis]|uniref:Cytidyltransferase-like domain-containing protein n=1 Tax=Apophysomyces ossiformis TaxID=679940 RepID=A0A8H7BKP3_9FUNG|nr:hypothetical protein EC973_008723 [Apophysomyces ossiformis]
MSANVVLYLTIQSFTLSSVHKEWIRQAVIRTLDQQRLIIVVTWPESLGNYNWQILQTLLGNIYVVQLTTAYDHGKPLFECNIILEPLSGYNIALEPNWSSFLCSQQDRPQLENWNNRRAIASLPTCNIDVLVDDNAKIPFTEVADKNNKPWETFRHVALGGTFDHLHAGHKILLTMAALCTTTRLVVGVTDDEMLKNKKYREYIASVQDRIENVRQYLHMIKRGITYEVVPISDPFGPTITDPTIEALICSHETLKGGEAVNRERSKLDFPALELRTIDVIAPDNASVQEKDMMLKISSTWIRQYLAEHRA